MDRVTRSVAEAVGNGPTHAMAVGTLCSPVSSETLYQRLASLSAASALRSAASSSLMALPKGLRRREAGDRKIITYCAGCITMLGPGTSHVLDLVFEPEASIAGRIRPSMPPFTYWNRPRLKSSLQKNIDTVVTRARPGPSFLPALSHLPGNQLL